RVEPGRRVAVECPLRWQGGVKLAVRVAAREVVEQVERDADVVGGRAVVRIELGDVAALGGDELPLLGGLGPRRAWEPLQRAGHTDHGRALEHLATSDVYGMYLHSMDPGRA